MEQTDQTLKGILTNTSPIYVTLGCGLALLYVCVKAWRFLNKLENRLVINPPNDLLALKQRIGIRRIVTFIFGMVLIIAFLQNVQMPLFFVIVCIGYCLDSLAKIGQANMALEAPQ